MVTFEHQRAACSSQATTASLWPRPQITSPVVQRAPTCACGGGCPRCQAKSNLPVSQPNEPAEREAGAVADRVMRMPEQDFSTVEPAQVSNGAGVHRTCAACEEEDEGQLLQAKAESSSTAGGNNIPTASPSVREVLNSAGAPLSPDTRAFFEPRFGRDLSDVRVHTGGAAARSAREVNALAYAVGAHVVFNAGQYAPHSFEGRRLLAHELTHVVQQTSEPVTRIERHKEAPVAHPISQALGPMIQRNGPAVGGVTPMSSQVVVFVGQETLLRDSPAEGANVLGKLPQGSSVRLISVQGDWYSVEAQVSGTSVIGYIKRSEAQPPPSLQGQQVRDPVTNTFAGLVGAQAEMQFVPHPTNSNYEVAVCDTGMVSVVYAREVANPAVILETTMNDAKKTPVEQWKAAKTIRCGIAP